MVQTVDIPSVALPRQIERPANIPFAMTSPVYVPAERYYSPEFYELEKQRLWSRAWQFACREDEIPKPGDFVEYTIADQSILLIRQRDNSIKGLFNACRHRATELAKGCGSLPGGRLVCPFHGWSYHLDGSIASVYGEESFDADCLRPEDVALRQCRVDTWAGFVYLTMDPDAPALMDALSPIPSTLAGVPVGDLKVRWWKAAIIEANWKTALEAFMEGWHSAQTHPQLTLGAGLNFNANFTYTTAHENGHAQLKVRPESFDMFVESTPGLTHLGAVLGWNQLLCDGLDGGLVLERDMHVLEMLRHRPVPEGSSVGAEAAALLYDYARNAGIAMPAPTEEFAGMWGSTTTIFPNTVFIPQFTNALMYRSRPLGPEKCKFEIWALTLPSENEDFGRPELAGEFSPHDESAWPLIFWQDYGNIERQQRGLHTRGYTSSRLSRTHEATSIGNLHIEIDRYLERA